MPTKREREYYAMGFRDGVATSRDTDYEGPLFPPLAPSLGLPSKPKRKLSAWQKYIKNKRNHITYRDGKLNLKAMGVQYRKKKRR
jgi:hypothetical protein